MPRNIGSACKITTGKLDANQAVKGGEYPFFTCAQYPDTIDSYAFDNDVVLVAGNNAQGNFHVSRFKGKFNAYQRTYVLTAKAGCSIDYIYYALKLELKRLRERSQGSQTKFLTMPILTGIHLKGLSFDEQSKIANVLTSLDAKIELNNRINAELEAMAKSLYDYWFV
jgi:type I restriction enzyme S subunit